MGYTHVLVFYNEHTIAFGTEDKPRPLGKALMEFLYGDMQNLSSDSVQKLHPYYGAMEAESREKMITEDLKKAQGQLLPKLQEKYMDIMEQLFSIKSMEKEPELKQRIARCQKLGSYGFFCKSALKAVTSDQGRTMAVDYVVTCIEDCIYIELLEFIRQDLVFKQCKNCNRYFIPKRSNMDYCQNVFTEDGRTCSEVGYSQTFAKSVKEDELLQAYTRAYKAHYARMSKPRKRMANLTREEFEAWYHQAKSYLDMARAGQIDGEAFKKWLKQ